MPCLTECGLFAVLWQCSYGADAAMVIRSLCIGALAVTRTHAPSLNFLMVNFRCCEGQGRAAALRAVPAAAAQLRAQLAVEDQAASRLVAC